LGPHQRKVTLHVFMCKILANMTQVSDVAPGPLVKVYNLISHITQFDWFILLYQCSSIVQSKVTV
jgi:hypothetical protein